jgi:hypothetical protein
MNVNILQFLNVFFLFILGKFFLNLPVSWFYLILVLLFAYSIENLFLYIKNKKINYFPVSSMTSGLGLLFMIKTPYIYLYFLLLTF